MYVGDDLFSEVVAVRLFESREKKRAAVHRITAALAELGNEEPGGGMDRARWVSSRVISCGKTVFNVRQNIGKMIQFVSAFHERS
jgi:hypothetical protein